MIFGNAAWGFRETPLEEQFKITADLGLKELELGIANAPRDIPLDVSENELENVKKLSEKYGVKISCAATGDDFTTGTDDIEKLKKVILICEKLGVKYLRIFAGFTALEEVTDEKFVIETHGGVNGFDDGVEHFMSTTTNIETLKKIISLLPGNTRLCYDPANLYAVGIEKPESFYDEIKDKVAYAHFKDLKKLPSGHFKPSFCGDSDMDWKTILKAMKGFEGICMFEYENTDDIKEGLEKSYKYIKSLI